MQVKFGKNWSSFAAEKVRNTNGRRLQAWSGEWVSSTETIGDFNQYNVQEDAGKECKDTYRKYLTKGGTSAEHHFVR